MNWLLKGGWYVDAKTAREGQYDVRIRQGRVDEVGEGLIAGDDEKVLFLEGKVIIPGLVDLHVHISRLLGGFEGHHMLARAGVTTAVDFSGPVDEVIEGIGRYGCGLNLACAEALRPGVNLPDSPVEADIRERIADALGRGALGIKIMGGHYPLTPEGTRQVIEACNREKVFVAFHAGSTTAGSNLEGLIQAFELARDQALYMAHINGYCRGLIDEPLEELKTAFDLLKKSPNVVSESHMARINGTGGHCRGGRPLSEVTKNCLRMGGYPDTEEGLAAAIADGYAIVNASKGHENTLLEPEEGLKRWEERATAVTISFPVNRADVSFLCATAKGKKGGFIVDVLSTDGGGIPRNVLIQKGLSLIAFGGLSWLEFVEKASLAPAKACGFLSKGHLSEGADADVTVVDPSRGEPYLTMAGGELVLLDGQVLGRGGTLMATARAADRLRDLGISFEIVDPARGTLYSGRE